MDVSTYASKAAELRRSLTTNVDNFLLSRECKHLRIELQNPELADPGVLPVNDNDCCLIYRELRCMFELRNPALNDLSLNEFGLNSTSRSDNHRLET